MTRPFENLASNIITAGARVHSAMNISDAKIRHAVLHDITTAMHTLTSEVHHAEQAAQNESTLRPRTVSS